MPFISHLNTKEGVILLMRSNITLTPRTTLSMLLQFLLTSLNKNGVILDLESVRQKPRRKFLRAPVAVKRYRPGGTKWTSKLIRMVKPEIPIFHHHPHHSAKYCPCHTTLSLPFLPTIV